MSEKQPASDRPKRLPKRKPQGKAEKRLVAATWYAALVVPILVIGIIVYHWDWAVDSKDASNFARAGAAMIVVDILAYGAVRWEADAVLSIAYWEGRRLWHIEVFFGFVTALTGVMGTAIWGYGDIVFELFS